MYTAIRKKRRNPAKTYAIAVVVILMLLIVGFHLRIKINGEMPYGLYYTVSDVQQMVGDYVLVCLPPQASEDGIKLGFIAEGSCAGGAMPVIRQIVALSGSVNVGLNGLEINGDRLPLSQRETYNKVGRLIPAIDPGNYDIKAGQMWSMGTGANRYNSWDSRYFGAVPSSNVIYTYRLVWEW